LAGAKRLICRAFASWACCDFAPLEAPGRTEVARAPTGHRPQAEALVRARNVCALAVVGQQLHDEPYLEFPEQRLGRAHDSELTADLDAIADLERPFVPVATTSSPRRSS
jgi:hypothetical protein